MASTIKFKTGYTRCTRSQLISLIKKYKTHLHVVANAPESETFGGKTKIQYARKIKKHLKTVSGFLRASVLADIDWKIKQLRTQMASRLGVAVSNTKTMSPAVKRLIEKRRKIASCKKISQLVPLVRNFKVSSFKNPKGVKRIGTVSTGTTSRRSVKGRRRTTTRRRTKSTRKYGTGTATTKKYRTETKKLRREIKSLKTRNTTLRKQVSKFRQEVAKLERHYSSLNRVPKWRVVGGSKGVGKEVSNIVRISNALTNALEQQRKAG